MSATANAIHARIHAAILEQLLPPGTKLSEETLCEIFGVSRTMIRQVLQRLAGEHVVEAWPHRGAFVARPSVYEAREVFEARRTLEAQVIGQLGQGLTAAAAERLRGHVAREQQAQARGRRRHLIRRSGEFHLLLAELAGNRVIAQFLRQLISRTSLIIAVYEVPGESCCPVDEHVAIIEALANSRADGAHRMMGAHLLGIEQRLRLDRLPERAVDLRNVLAAGRRPVAGQRGTSFASGRARTAEVLSPDP
jgi:DNA-binding GntR family transcriptional regulator